MTADAPESASLSALRKQADLANPLPEADAAGVAPARRSRLAGLDDERLGLVEALLDRPLYRSLLAIGLDAVAFAATLSERCRARTVMDIGPCVDPSGPDGVRRVPLNVPPRLPSGRYELVIVSEVLPLFGDAIATGLGHALVAHRACREIIVVSPLDETGGDRGAGPAFEALRRTLGEGFVHRELALRRRYRLDALCRTRADKG